MEISSDHSLVEISSDPVKTTAVFDDERNVNGNESHLVNCLEKALPHTGSQNEATTTTSGDIQLSTSQCGGSCQIMQSKLAGNTSESCDSVCGDLTDQPIDRTLLIDGTDNNNAVLESAMCGCQGNCLEGATQPCSQSNCLEGATQLCSQSNCLEGATQPCSQGNCLEGPTQPCSQSNCLEGATQPCSQGNCLECATQPCSQGNCLEGATQPCSELGKDLLQMYTDGVDTDICLRLTTGETFLAHRSVQSMHVMQQTQQYFT